MERTDTFDVDDTASWLKHFEDAGYCILRSVFTPEELRGAQAGCEALVDDLAKRLTASGKIEDDAADAAFDRRLLELTKNVPQELPNLYRPELHRPEFYPLLCSPRLLELIATKLVPDADALRIFPNYSARPKTRTKIHAVTWHQDAGLRADGGPSTASVEDRLAAFGIGRIVNAWAPLVPARKENGAMKFIAGSHVKMGLLEHRIEGACTGVSGDGTQMPGMSDADASEVAAGKIDDDVPAGSYYTGVSHHLSDEVIASAVDIECDPGDVVLFNNILIHRGGVNMTDRIRWSFDWRFQDASKPTFRKETGHVVWPLTAVGAVKDAEDWAARRLS